MTVKANASTAKPKNKTKPKPSRALRLSPQKPPQNLAADDWQRALRRQFGREQTFLLENVGHEPVFSEFLVSNPTSKSRYRVAIRGINFGDNFCACPDYASNELGTCKHIEFTLAALERKRGAKKILAAGYRPAFSELYLRAGLNGEVRTVCFRAGSDCPPALAVAAAAVFDATRNGALIGENYGALDALLASAAKLGHELRAYDDALNFIAGRRDSQRRAVALAEAFPRGSKDKKLGRLLKVPLYPYQAEGALFALRAGRCLIGDEMGLGKTIQAIAATELLAQLCGVTRVLVICPTSLKYQWQQEIKRFSGRESRVIAGGRVQRQCDFAEDDFCKITNYEKLQPDHDLITGWAPELVIVDEAQRVKNWNTIAARALKRIDSPYVVVLTGTPLENKLEELISIVQFVDQYRLGPTWKLLHEHQVRDQTGRVTGYTNLERIGQTLAPVMIRRRKSEVLQQLPARTDQTLLVPMTEPQMVYHKENAEVVSKIVSRWRRTGYLSDIDQRRMTCALQNMRMACNSTYLLDQETDHGVKADEAAALFDELFTQPDAKAVVFSQWTRTHDILIRRLDARGIGYVSFHGGIPSEKRPALIERFRDDPDCRVFLSTDAGSTGLNLQHASTLLNMDLPWNPAILEQRIGRIHRNGQTRPVQIVNFVAKGTIEEGMLSVLAFKRSLSAGILDGGVSEISMGGSRLNRFMKDVENVTGAMDATGASETVSAEEEVVATAPPSTSADTQSVSPEVDGGPAKVAADSSSATGDPASEPPAAPGAAASSDPWSALVHLGAQFAAALTSPEANAAAHPWIRSDAITGQRRLDIPLPPPEVAAQIADVLAGLAQALRPKS